MGTNNFYYRNTSKAFVICENYEQPVLDDDGNETDETTTVCPESWECEDELENITSSLKEQKGKFEYHKYTDLRSEHENRNFPSTYIGTLYTTKNYGDIQCEVEINCFARSGYYEAACLDYETKITVDNESFYDETPDMLDIFLSCSPKFNNGMLKIQGGNCEKWCDKTQSEMKEQIEKVFESVSNTYRKVGSFSNGETIYEKC